MFGSWKIARIAGIDLSIHWTFWLVPLLVIFDYNSASPMPLWMHLVLVGCLFVCVVLHEFGHALTAKQFGIRTRSITLSPLGGIAQLERMSQKPWEEFWIAIAGPLVNVAIAAILGGAALWTFVLAPHLVDTLGFTFLSVLLGMNVVLVLFNLLPVFPMDGGRVLRAILSSSMGLLKGTRAAVTVGTVLAVIMGTAGFFWTGNIILPFICLFVIWAGHQELAALEYEDRRRSEPVRMTVCLWDSRLGGWVRHDVSERAR
jgi:Zn-dependent protease